MGTSGQLTKLVERSEQNLPLLKLLLFPNRVLADSLTGERTTFFAVPV